MLELTKKLPTRRGKVAILLGTGRTFWIPKASAARVEKILSRFEDPSDNGLVTPEEAFADLYKKHGKVGTMIRGARSRDGLTQVQLAKELGITQSNVAAMESEKRLIGKDMAKRLAKVFKMDYRVFL